MAAVKDWIDESDNIVFFGGLVSPTESGIPDFRSVDRLYNQKYKYPPERIISHNFYIQNPEEFYRFYKDRNTVPDTKPNYSPQSSCKTGTGRKIKGCDAQNIDRSSPDGRKQRSAGASWFCTQKLLHRCGQFMILDYVKKQ